MKTFRSLLTSLAYLAVASPVWAVSDNGGGGSGGGLPQIPNGNLSLADLATVFARIFYFLIGIVGAFAIIMIIIGGIRYILASGDEKATLAAKGTITFAVVGLIIVLLAVTMVSILGNLLGVQNLNVIRIGLP